MHKNWTWGKNSKRKEKQEHGNQHQYGDDIPLYQIDTKVKIDRRKNDIPKNCVTSRKTNARKAQIPPKQENGNVYDLEKKHTYVKNQD